MTTAGLAQSWTSWWGLALVLVPLLANAKALPGIWHVSIVDKLIPSASLPLYTLRDKETISNTTTSFGSSEHSRRSKTYTSRVLTSQRSSVQSQSALTVP